jgi:hypothetical protein
LAEWYSVPVKQQILRVFCRIMAVWLTLLAGRLSYGLQADLQPPMASPTMKMPQFDSGGPIHIVVYGDSRFTDPSVTQGTNPRVRQWLAQRIALEHPAVLMLTGDTPYTGAKDADWEVFQKETAVWRDEHILVLPTTGNHEIYGGYKAGIVNYLKNFPEVEGYRHYSALLGSVEVIALDCTVGGDASSDQAEWFAAQLDHLPEQVHFLMILYHIPWVADRQSQIFINLPSKDALVLRNILEAHLSKIHARVMVFNGHIHNYERFERRGVEYVVTGGGGAQPYPLLYRGRGDLYRDPGFPVYHYLTLDVTDNQMHAVMWKIANPDASELTVEAKDEFTLTAPKKRPPRAKSPQSQRSQ